ncbi:MAG: glycoside hydrolase family 57 protein [Clostridia bacterium]
MQKKGYVSFVLHAHLPFIHHPESNDYLEESWLYEAISETYIPLLKNFKKLVDEGVNFRITMSMTPPLLSMLDNKLLQQKYINYLENLIELSEKEIKRTTFNEKMNKLSKYYYERYSEDLRLFRDEFKCDLISQFKHFQDIGVLEIITCGATHGYFPILYVNEKTVRAQIAVGVQTYERYFGKKPRGIWLPECGYVPEADKYLREFGVDYAIVESHGVLYANPTPVYGTLAPIVSPQGFTVFGRDMESSRQVWSSINGYPGDYNYRDFYRDIGYEADYDYIKPYIAHNGVRVHTGIKYHRITGDTDNKDIYDIQWAKDSAERQAGHFLNSRTEQIENASHYMNKPPIVLCPYDAELYGHWWYEGPYWLYILFKKIYYDECNFELITPSEYMDKYPEIQQCQPCRSSWGANGYSEVWLNPSNDYAHKHLHTAGDRMCELAYKFKDSYNVLNDLDNKIKDLKKEKKPITSITSSSKYRNAKLQVRALNQAARELLLAQSSDWLFIITNNTMVDYAHRRIKDHIGRFTRLYNELNSGKIDRKFLTEIEEKDPVFPDIDYRIYL